MITLSCNASFSLALSTLDKITFIEIENTNLQCKRKNKGHKSETIGSNPSPVTN